MCSTLLQQKRTPSVLAFRLTLFIGLRFVCGLLLVFVGFTLPINYGVGCLVVFVAVNFFYYLYLYHFLLSICSLGAAGKPVGPPPAPDAAVE